MFGLATGSLGGALGATVVCGAGWLWLRRMVSKPSSVHSSVRAIRLSAEHAVHVVEVEGRTLLLGTGPGGPPALLAEFERERGRGA